MRLGSRYLIRSWALPILLAGLALAFDAADRKVPFSVLASGALDEPAHLATGALGLLALSCFIDAPRRFYVAGLIASVAIDLDHVPMYLGVGNPSQRPVTHSLATVVVVVVAAAASRGTGPCGRRGGRAADPFRPGHRRGPARGADALAAFKHGLDGQCPVVLGPDHRVHGRAADPGNPRHPPYAHPPVSGASSGQVPLFSAIGRATPGDRDPDIEMAGSEHAGADGPAHLKSAAITGSSRRARASRTAPRTCGRPARTGPGRRMINIPNGPGARPATASQSLEQVKSSAPAGRREEA